MTSRSVSTDADSGTNYWGILSDAHGNPDGLAACVATLRARGARRMLFLGDAVGYLPLEGQVLEILSNEGFECICGNHDAMLLGRISVDLKKDAVYGIQAARGRLNAAQLALMESWPRERELPLAEDGTDSVLLVHGGPDDAWHQYVHPDSPLDGFDAGGHRAVFIGQTHRPFVRTVNNTLVVNVGSCGLPRDVGHLASCVLFDPLANNVEILRVPFDVDALLERAENIASIDPSVRQCLHRNQAATSGVRVPGQ